MYTFETVGMSDAEFSFEVYSTGCEEFKSPENAIKAYLQSKADVTCRMIGTKTKDEAYALVMCFVTNIGHFREIAKEAGCDSRWVDYLYRECIKQVNSKARSFRRDEYDYYEQVYPFALG